MKTMKTMEKTISKESMEKYLPELKEKLQEMQKNGIPSEYEKINLLPVNGRKSFMGKASLYKGGAYAVLKSYDTIVGIYDTIFHRLYLIPFISNTTTTHINSFLDYFGIEEISRKNYLDGLLID